METQDNKKKEPAKQPLKTRDDKRAHDIDANLSISEMRNTDKGDKLEDQTGDSENDKTDDAMNYKNDRDHGTYNPKNI